MINQTIKYSIFCKLIKYCMKNNKEYTGINFIFHQWLMFYSGVKDNK